MLVTDLSHGEESEGVNYSSKSRRGVAQCWSGAKRGVAQSWKGLSNGEEDGGVICSSKGSRRVAKRVVERRLMGCEVKRPGRIRVGLFALSGDKEDQGFNQRIIKKTCRNAGSKQSVIRWIVG